MNDPVAKAPGELPHVEAFTDGACKGNPGPGGWGVVLRAKDQEGRATEKELSGGEAVTTNNRMELTAAIQALHALKRPCRVAISTDSRYVMDGLTKWVHGWRKNGWRTADRKPVKNAELWQALIEASAPHRVEWTWVKGHAGHPENERADKLASAAAKAAGRQTPPRNGEGDQGAKRLGGGGPPRAAALVVGPLHHRAAARRSPSPFRGGFK